MSEITLLGCNIVEKDINNEVLWTWTYPSITDEKQKFVLRKFRLGIELHSPQPFIFLKYEKDWCYLLTVQVFETDNLPQVKQFAFTLWAKDFNPEKYESLCRLLSKRYCKTGNAAVVLQLYLSVLTKGVCTTEENGTFVMTEFDQKKLSFPTQVKELIKMFGLETILIYTCLLLKKKLIIYHHSLEILLKWIRTFPFLMTHRDLNDNLLPWIDLVDSELQYVKVCNGVIAGCRDSSVCTREDVYDILVNLPAQELTISPHARDSFCMTKTHKDIAMFMVQLAENVNISETQVIHEIAAKTEELVVHLKSLATINTPDGPKLSLQLLKEKNLAASLEMFLFNLAVAEDMILL